VQTGDVVRMERQSTFVLHRGRTDHPDSQESHLSSPGWSSWDCLVMPGCGDWPLMGASLWEETWTAPSCDSTSWVRRSSHAARAESPALSPPGTGSGGPEQRHQDHGQDQHG